MTFETTQVTEPDITRGQRYSKHHISCKNCTALLLVSLKVPLIYWPIGHATDRLESKAAVDSRERQSARMSKK